MYHKNCDGLKMFQFVWTSGRFDHSDTKKKVTELYMFVI